MHCHSRYNTSLHKHLQDRRATQTKTTTQKHNTHLLEAPLQCWVLLDVLPVLVQGCCSNAAQLSTSKLGLQQVAYGWLVAVGLWQLVAVGWWWWQYTIAVLVT